MNCKHKMLSIFVMPNAQRAFCVVLLLSEKEKEQINFTYIGKCMEKSSNSFAIELNVDLNTPNCFALLLTDKLIGKFISSTNEIYMVLWRLLVKIQLVYNSQ